MTKDIVMHFTDKQQNCKSWKSADGDNSVNKKSAEQIAFEMHEHAGKSC